jgi:Protein of unknown function (DUF2867)
MGLRGGRPDPVRLRPGDRVDFFRVLEVSEGNRLLLLAERKFPGEATLEFRVYPLQEGRTELRQLSRFLPKGISGLTYWYALYPFHQFVFKAILQGIVREVGKPIIEGPHRFAPRLSRVCRMDPKQ